MTDTVRQGYIEFPAEWEYMESNTVGLFVTRVVHQKPDGQIDTRTSRRHRKGFGPE